MLLEAGKEREFIGHRLADLIFFAEKTQPVNDDWEGYAKQLCRMVASSARDAQIALAVLKD